MTGTQQFILWLTGMVLATIVSLSYVGSKYPRSKR